MFPVIWFVFSKLSWRKARIFFSYKTLQLLLFIQFLIFLILRRYNNKINDLSHLQECFLDLKTLTTTKHNNKEGGQNKIQCSNLF